MTNVKEIEWQGGIYPIADETARGEAQQARALANTAQTTANAAQTTANTAQTTADNAQTTANTAQTTANTAQTTADNISTQFSDYKKLESATASFGTRGTVTFRKRGNVCEVYITETDSEPGVYTVPIPPGFEPIWGTGVGGLPLTWGGQALGYWITLNGNIVIHVDKAHSITATHVFLM